MNNGSLSCIDSLWRFFEMNEKKKIQYRGIYRHYFRIPLYLMIILAALNVGVYLINVEAGLLVSVGVLFCLLVAVIIYNFQKKFFEHCPYLNPLKYFFL